jgi:hypothetical protein
MSRVSEGCRSARQRRRSSAGLATPTPAPTPTRNQGVALHGTGAWAAIIAAGRDIFAAQRTNVDLKDKWRNMVRSGEVGLGLGLGLG